MSSGRIHRPTSGLGDLLAEGWSRFTGTVVVLDSPQPEGVPIEYVMRPFEIKLAYVSQHWLTVAFVRKGHHVGDDDSGQIPVPCRPREPEANSQWEPGGRLVRILPETNMVSFIPGPDAPSRWP